MQNERKRILDMVENGQLSASEALVLLEKLNNDTTNTTVNTSSHSQSNSQSQSTYSAGQQYSEKKDPKADEFIEDLKRDFTQFGDKFMQFMQTAVGKVKTFDFDMPFGEAKEFHHRFTKENESFEDISVELANGKLEILTSDSNEVRAECHVKSYRTNEEDPKKLFMEKFLFVVDNGKLRIISDLKATQVNVKLFIPAKKYQTIKARLINGAIHMQTVKATEVNVETVNGRIYIDGELRDIEASSVNGHVVVTTTDKEAKKIEASAIAGSVEIYIPSSVSLEGEISSHLGKMDVALQDVQHKSESEQFLQKRIRFSKQVDGFSGTPLKIEGEAKMGSVLVKYSSTAQ
ncbi:DUF4097 family beta strand repeat-containing protein [Paenisporosarcina cavernae]|uniref:Adhesin domain-containing protein n=1 Tax=Paenisporosarcina cavernae TaxID=2320858 RepID=A0A385YX44_9BACL|nr:DUF4097 family beta strand repeat-containing protein [Paenisporosarcina cavernae]AYC30123.1 hypothetical protein D3873_09650 [Paenisporosarcina cavernae]